MTPRDSTIDTIDCRYREPGRAAAYLIAEPGHAAFVDNNTAHAAPLLLDALQRAGMTPEQVEALIITHVHLDHAGGTSALLGACPNAVVLCHPNAARHLIDPARLTLSARQVYGEETFARLYGEIHPIPESRVRTVEDMEPFRLGGRTLTFLHTPGHAKHHVCMHDSGENAVFTGDTFGVAYAVHQMGPRPFLLCSTAPTDFDPAAARRSIERILATGADCVYLSHFGSLDNPRAAGEDLMDDIARMEAILEDAASASILSGEALVSFCQERVRDAVRTHLEGCGIAPQGEAMDALLPDIQVNGQGLAVAAERRRRAAGG
ncbi:MAG TPA: MBL fold metallo-hydrolase [Candidatus Hydrogenedentes bacterium]|nr:MBL fold metallo-hydrolase [Candidatus Hydrogenedentota bacterium]HOS01919.1 MBL fold metallo-hydrolase [Candidatus Hydrogenedentota bacterium]